MRTVRTDAKRRITLPGSRPGEVYEVIEEEPGHYSLARLVALPPRRRQKTVSEVEEAMESAPLKPATTWEQLRKLTREL
ncbi:MAG: hypothetical protein F7B06_01500 [Opitutae bacterium]|nr:hypothetical protein [Opitutae bacterium]MBC9888533.1 hypothetical protein [Opitutae bacterium]